jgi:hypothetical protein
MKMPYKGPEKADPISRLDGEVIEVSLLLPAWQMAALERCASSRGLTLGQLLRLLIRDHLTCQPDPAAPGDPGRPASRPGPAPAGPRPG